MPEVDLAVRLVVGLPTPITVIPIPIPIPPGVLYYSGLLCCKSQEDVWDLNIGANTKRMKGYHTYWDTTL
jgi:hypothetical protein